MYILLHRSLWSKYDTNIKKKSNCLSFITSIHAGSYHSEPLSRQQMEYIFKNNKNSLDSISPGINKASSGAAV